MTDCFALHRPVPPDNFILSSVLVYKKYHINVVILWLLCLNIWAPAGTAAEQRGTTFAQGTPWCEALRFLPFQKTARMASLVRFGTSLCSLSLVVMAVSGHVDINAVLLTSQEIVWHWSKFGMQDAHWLLLRERNSCSNLPTYR